MEPAPAETVKTESPKTDSKEEGICFSDEVENTENQLKTEEESVSMRLVDQTTTTTTGSSGFESSEGPVRLIKCVVGGEKKTSSGRLKKRRFKQSTLIDENGMSSIEPMKTKIIYPQKDCLHCNAESHNPISGEHDPISRSPNHTGRNRSHELTVGTFLNNSSFYRIPENKSYHGRKHHHSKEDRIIVVNDAERNINLGFSKAKQEDCSSNKRADTIVTTAPNYLKAEVKTPPFATMTTSTFVERKLDNYRTAHQCRWFTPTEVIQRFGSYLSDFEKNEILHYKKIWYFGKDAAKLNGRNEPYNGGYDNKKSEYKTVSHDHIAYRYEMIETIGKGAFGEVVLAYDHKKLRKVALKIIKNRPNLHEQARQEVKVLRTLARRDPKGKNFSLHIYDSFTFRNHPCIVCELIGANLFEVLKQGNFRGLPVKVIRSVTKCILRCLAILSKESIIHCDIKPENILLIPGDEPHVKLIDFGSSCLETEQVYNYIQSRYYRAPEVILGLRYSKRIDMWSLGCVLAELYMGTPLFPGTDEADQLQCIANLLGEPPEEMLSKSKSFEKTRNPKLCSNKLVTSTAKTLDVEIGPVDPDFMDFIRRCLVWKPEDRMTVEEALKHPWIKHAKSSKRNFDTKKNRVLHSRTVFSDSPMKFTDLHGPIPTDKRPDRYDSGVCLEWLHPLDPNIRNPRHQKTLI